MYWLHFNTYFSSPGESWPPYVQATNAIQCLSLDIENLSCHCTYTFLCVLFYVYGQLSLGFGKVIILLL